jgi:hypothetical protein
MHRRMLADVDIPCTQGVPARTETTRRERRARTARRVQAALLALALLSIACLPRLATATAAHPSTPAVARSSEEKQRVPKPPPEQPRTKPDHPAKGSSSNDKSDGDDSGVSSFLDCFGSCLESCVDGTFEALMTEIFKPHRRAPALADSTFVRTTPAPADSFAAPFADTTGAPGFARIVPSYQPRVWARFDVGFLRASLPGDSVVLRRAPFDPESLLLEAGRLPNGTRVLVTQARTGAGGAMLEVSPVDTQGLSGWVQAKSVREAPHWTAPAAAAVQLATVSDSAADDATRTDSLAASPGGEAPALPVSSRERAMARRAGERWAIVLAGGIARIENPALAQEYSSAGLACEAEYLQLLPRACGLGAGIGYQEQRGTPVVEYVGATMIDQPEHSRFRLTYGTLEFGQRHAWREGLRLGYFAGPVVGYVSEDATVRVLDAGTRQPLGTRHESLGRWAGGGGATTWIGVALPAPLELGLRIRAFGLAWAGRHEKSLTSDYTDEGLFHIDAAITLTHAGH